MQQLGSTNKEPKMVTHLWRKKLYFATCKRVQYYRLELSCHLRYICSMYTKYKNAGAILHAQLLQIPEIILYAWTYPSVKLRCVNGSPLDDSSSEMRSRCKSKEANAGQQPNEIHGWTANIHCCKKKQCYSETVLANECRWASKRKYDDTGTNTYKATGVVIHNLLLRYACAHTLSLNPELWIHAIANMPDKFVGHGKNP